MCIRDSFTFVQKIENISFLEAVCKVAELIHYPLHMDTSQFQPKVDQNQPLYDCVQSYIRFLTYELQLSLIHIYWFQSKKTGKESIETKEDE